MNFDGMIFNQICESIELINKSNKSAFDNIKRIVNTVSNNWQGDAANTFVNKMKKTTSTFDSYINELDKAALYLKEINSQAEELEKRNSQIASLLKY